ncbi:MAG TPA: DMT family transporter [Verrucomicrobiae bacterium]|nr:DMT family transporter [Verrucomicrobiae bacterium]
MFPAILTTVLWSISVVCATRSTRHLGGAIANLTRLCLAMLLLAVWAYGFGKGLSGPGLRWFLFSGFVGFGLGDVALYEALPRLGSRLTLLLAQCLAAPVGALIEWLWLGTTLTLAQIVAGLVILAGVAVGLAPRSHLHLDRRHLFISTIFGVLAAIGQGGGAVLSRKAFLLATHAGQSIDGGTAAYQRIVGGIGVAAVYFGFRWLRGTHARGVSRLEWRAAWPWVVMNTLGGPVLGVACYQWALSTTPSGVVLPIVATLPLAVIPFSYHIEDDRPGWQSILGGAISVAGVIALTLVR